MDLLDRMMEQSNGTIANEEPQHKFLDSGRINQFSATTPETDHKRAASKMANITVGLCLCSVKTHTANKQQK